MPMNPFNQPQLHPQHRVSRLLTVALAAILITACSAAPAPAPTATTDSSLAETQQAQTRQVSDASTATSNVIGTATAVRGQTATVEAAPTQTAIARTAIVQVTAQARADGSTATSQARATAEVVAGVTGTANAIMITPLLDALFAERSPENLDALMAYLEGTSPIFGPESGQIRHDPSNEFVEEYEPNYLVRRNFVVRVEFITPYNGGATPWDFGIFFRNTSTNDQFRVVITSYGVWELHEWQGGLNRIAGRNSGSLRVPGPENLPMTLLLVVREDDGLFFADGQYIGFLDLSHNVTTGGLFIGVGAFSHEKEGAVTSFNDFTAWDVPEP